MSELSTDARALIDAARAGDDPERRDKARVRARLAQQLGAGAFAGAAVLTAVSSASSPPMSGAATIAPSVTRLGSALWVKSLGTAAAVVATAGAIYSGSVLVGSSREPIAARSEPQTSRTPEPTPTVVQLAPREPVTEALPHEATPEPAAEPRRSERRRRHRRAREAAAAAVDQRADSAPRDESTLTAELTLLAKAQKALRDRRARDALGIVAAHAARFPNGTLEEERTGIEAMARCMLDEPGAAAGARTFLAESPDSPLASRVRKVCEPW